MISSLPLMTLLSKIKVFDSILVPSLWNLTGLWNQVYKETTKIRNLKESDNCKGLYGDDKNNSPHAEFLFGIPGITEDSYTFAMAFQWSGELGVT